MNGSYADTLLVVEQAHILRFAVWAACALIVGVLFLVLERRVLGRGPLLRHFALQAALWGAVDLVIAGSSWRGLALRDHGAAVALDRFLWLSVGLDVGYVIAGITLAGAGWFLGRRLGAVGAGLGVAVQGTALLVLDVAFATQVGRLL